MIKKTNYRATAITIIIHVLVLGIGFNILAVVFEFPDILRQSAEYRLTLFTENSGIVVPYFAEAMNRNVPMETIAFVEGMLNRYAGMAIGEHLGFLCQAAWTTLIGVIMLRHKLFSRRLGWAAIIIGLLSFPMSMEPLGGFLTILGELTWPVGAAWLIWLVVVAISLLRTDEETQTGMMVGWKTVTISALAWIIFVIPAYM